jgi:hypothetical protein
MKSSITHLPWVGPWAASQADNPISTPADGIEVREQELGVVYAQRLYKLRCECGRSWFDLDLPEITECPACHRLAIVKE